jgi:cysteine desulfurase
VLRFPIYLDNHSTTKVDPRVLEAMLPYFTENYGNAASKAHEFGWKAEAAVELARKKIANLINSEPGEIIFTSGATESINLAIKGIAENYVSKGNQVITTPIEHKAGLDSYKSLEKKGYNIVYLNADKYGMTNPDELERAINDKTILVSIILANNEIGTINDIAEIGKICREKKVLFHTDATQAVGKIPVDAREMKIDLMSFSSHKMYGPKGIGALYISGKFPKIKLTPQIDGGGHEKGLRSGTLNVPAIIGFGKACEINKKEMVSECNKIGELRDKLENAIIAKLDGVYLNGHPEKRLYNNLNLSFEGIEADALIMSIKDIAVSSGSACSSATLRPSHVLKAIGLPDKLVKSSIRFGLGRFNTAEEIKYVINKVVEKVNNLRDISPAYSKETDRKTPKGVRA